MSLSLIRRKLTGLEGLDVVVAKASWMTTTSRDKKRWKKQRPRNKDPPSAKPLGIRRYPPAVPSAPGGSLFRGRKSSQEELE